jgi:hypothetical protein
MLNILEGDEEFDDGQPDEMVLCRLCEQQVLRSSLQLHTAVCKATHKAKSDDEAVNREVRELLGLLASTRRQALLSLITIAVQRHTLLCGPLDKLVDLGGQLLKNDEVRDRSFELSPCHSRVVPLLLSPSCLLGSRVAGRPLAAPPPREVDRARAGARAAQACWRLRARRLRLLLVRLAPQVDHRREDLQRAGA